MSLGVNISDLPGYGALVGSELFEIEQAGVNKQISLNAILTYLGVVVNPGLTQVLVNGNSTGGNPIVVDDADYIQLGTSTGGTLNYNAISGYLLLSNSTSTDYIRLLDTGGVELRSLLGYHSITTSTHAFTMVQGVGITIEGNAGDSQIFFNESSGVLDLSSVAYINLDSTVKLPNLTGGYLTMINGSNNLAESPYSVDGGNFLLFPNNKGVDSVTPGGTFSIGASSASALNYGNGSTLHTFIGTDVILPYSTPLTSTSATPKAYVDSLIEGLDWKEQVAASTTANITLSGEQTLDGVLTSASRVLVRFQTDPKENGIWTSASGAWSRTLDANTGAELEYAVVEVRAGTLYGGNVYRCNTYPITIGVTSITFAEWNVATYSAGTGLTLTGSVFSISATYTGQTSITTIGTIVTGVWNGTSITTSYTDAKIKGAVAATSGVIPYGNGTADTVTTSTNLTWSGTILKAGSTAFTSSLSGGQIQLEGTDAFFAAQSTSALGTSGIRFGQNNTIYGTLQSQGTSVAGNWGGTTVARTSATELIAGGTATQTMILAATTLYNFIGITATNYGSKLDVNGLRIDQIQYLNTANTAGIALSVQNGGTNLGNYASPTAQRLLTIGQDTAFMSFGSRIGTTSQVAMYGNQATPSSTNWFVLTDGSALQLNATNGALTFQTTNTNRYVIATTTGSHTWTTGNASGSATTYFNWTAGNSTTQTLSTAIPKATMTLGTCQWNTGALAATQKSFNITQPVMSFVAASTATLAASVGITGAYDASTNATITTSVGLLIQSAAVNSAGTVTTSYGAYINAQTGAGSNYALGVNGSLQMSGRILGMQGADVASANNLSLGTDGNSFEITGTTQINLISNIGWQNGSEVIFVFTSTPTVKHNQTTSGTNITIQLLGATDFVATAGDTLRLILLEVGGTQAWRQIAGAVI